MKIQIRQGAKVTQQEGRRVLLQLKEEVDAVIENLLKTGQIQWIDTMTNV